jgi:hypothetical protein
MPITAAQLAAGANYQLMSYADNDPIDNFTPDMPFSRWLIKNRKDVIYSNGIFNEKVRISNSSNYQNYSYDDQVSYNSKDTVRLAPFQHFEAHDGFGMTETDLANNGIVLTDDRNAVASEDEKRMIVNHLEENYETLKNGYQENWDLEVHQNGTQSTKAVPGLDALISTTPATGVVGGLDPSVYTFWQNRVSLSINSGTTGNLTTAMEQTWRACITVGRRRPDAIFCGGKFFDAYRNDAPLNVQRQVFLNNGPSGNIKGGMYVDNGAVGDGQNEGVFFKGIPVIWDPIFDLLQSLLAPAVPWDKRCYFLNSKSLRLKPFKGRWMINRKPARVYDRYTHYWGLTSDYGMTINQRNNMAVMSIA